MTRVSTNSTLPAQAAFHHAVLRHLALHPDGDRRRNIHEAVPNLMGLSEVQRTERLANLPHLRYRHRSGWALSMLKSAGYVDSPEPGIWRITDRGRDLLARYPDGFDAETARQVIREGRREIQGEDASDDSALGGVGATIQQTPDERIDTALGEIHRLVAEELLDKIAQAPPVFFEDLVLDLLHALGYGARGSMSKRNAGKDLSVDRKCKRFTARLQGGVHERGFSSPPQVLHGKPESSGVKWPTTSC